MRAQIGYWLWQLAQKEGEIDIIWIWAYLIIFLNTTKQIAFPVVWMHQTSRFNHIYIKTYYNKKYLNLNLSLHWLIDWVNQISIRWKYFKSSFIFTSIGSKKLKYHIFILHVMLTGSFVITGSLTDSRAAFLFMVCCNV
jgi:hypothetical protein